MTIKKQYEKAVDQYIKDFSKKHDIDFEFWVGDDVGAIAAFGDYYIDFGDVRYDIDTCQNKHFIFEWQEYFVENAEKGYINYKSYCMGARL